MPSLALGAAGTKTPFFYQIVALSPEANKAEKVDHVMPVGELGSAGFRVCSEVRAAGRLFSHRPPQMRCKHSAI